MALSTIRPSKRCEGKQPTIENSFITSQDKQGMNKRKGIFVKQTSAVFTLLSRLKTVYKV